MANYVISIMVDAKDKNTKQVLAGVGQELQGLGDTAERTGDRMGQAFTGAGIAMAFGQAIPLIKSAVASYNELRAGIVGLQSIVKYSGEDWGQAKAAMEDYIADGLVPMSQATTALKNLLLRGYGLEKSIELLGRFKDAAAYGRQGALTMGQAITSASEGLKNENSILVDNAGVTKNVSVMWKEYAATIGTTVGKLTQAQKLQAEYNGILAETAPMLGNAAELTGELSGKMAQAEAKVLELKQAIGEAFAPTVAGALDKVTPLIGVIKEFAQTNPMATMTLLGGAGLVAAVGALAAAFALMGTGGAVVVGVVTALVALGGALAYLAERFPVTTSGALSQAQATQTLSGKISTLAGEYEKLTEQGVVTAEGQEELDSITDALIQSVPELSGLTRDQAQAWTDAATAARSYVDELDAIADKEVARLISRQAQAEAALASAERFRDKMVEEGKAGGDAFQAVLKGVASARTEVEALDRAILALISSTLPEDYWGGGEDDVDTGGLEKVMVWLTRCKEGYYELKQASYWMLSGQEIQMWNETSEAIGDATQWLEAFYASKKTGEEESLASFEASFRGHLNRMGKDMSTWKTDMASMVGSVGDTFAATWAALVSNNEDALDQLRDYWENFFSWLIGEITRIIVKWFIGQVLTSLGIPGGGTIADIGMDVIGDSTGSWSGDARQMARSGFSGLQEATLMDGGAMMRGVARGSYTRDAVPVYADQGGAGAPVVVEEHTHFHSADYPSFRRSIRGGQLGRELAIAQRHGRVGR